MGNIKNNLKFHYGAKKSVALIFTTILLVGFFSFNIAEAVTQQDIDNDNAAITALNATQKNTFNSPAVTEQYKQKLSELNAKLAADQASYNTQQLSQTQAPGTIQQTTNQPTPPGTFDAPAGSSQTANSAPTANQAQTTNEAAAVERGKISLLGYLSGVVGKVTNFATNSIQATVSTIINFIFQFVLLPIASISLAISGMILDYSIQYTIFGDGFKTMSDTIQNIWILIRDVANIFFIFILLYSAIQQIVSGSLKKQLIVSVIISAVLINFSLFATRIVVDASNLAATAIYNQITVTAGPSGNIIVGSLNRLGGGTFGNPKVDLSGRIMDGLGLATIFDSRNMSSDKTISNTLFGVGSVITSFLQLAMFIIATWVFYILAALLIARFITLVILMATAPIGFLGDTIPFLGDAARIWQKNLLNACLMAPALMFFMLLTIRLSQSLSSSGSTTPMILFFNFFFVTYLLYKSVEIVKDLSGTVGKVMDTVAKGLAVAGAAVVAAPVLVGAAGGASAVFGSGAMAAGETAAAAGGSRWGARLAFTGKNLLNVREPGKILKELGSTGFGKLVTGDQDKTGALGWAQGVARDKFMSGTKEATSGHVDLKGVEKYIKDSTKAAVKNVSGAAAQVDGEAKKKAAVIESAGEAAAKKAERMPEGPTDIEHAESENEVKILKEKKEKAEVKVKEKEEILKNTSGPGRGFAEEGHAEAVKELAVVNTDFTKAEQSVAKFMKDYKEKQKEAIDVARKAAMEEAAIELGVVGKVIEKGGKMVIDSLENAKANFIRDRIRGGNYFTTLLNEAQRKELADKLDKGEKVGESDEEKLINRIKEFEKGQKEKKKDDKAK